MEKKLNIRLLIVPLVIIFFILILMYLFYQDDSKYLILAILHGVLEWLPVSSSGQVMIVAINVFGISPEHAFSLSIWLHLGTMFAVLLKFRKEYIEIIKTLYKKPFEFDEKNLKRRNWIITSTVGTVITGLPLYIIFRLFLVNEFSTLQGEIITLIITGFLIITGIILLINKRIYGSNTLDDVDNKIIFKDGFFAGLIQGIAILPGISRSGVTTSAILFEKYEQDTALKLSFIMSVPVIIGSIIVDLIFAEGSVFGFLDIFTIILITIISFIVGYITIEVLLKIAQKLEFGYFCIIYGLIAFAIIIPFMIIS